MKIGYTWSYTELQYAGENQNKGNIYTFCKIKIHANSLAQNPLLK
jgi:hypothetical protein